MAEDVYEEVEDEDVEYANTIFADFCFELLPQKEVPGRWFISMEEKSPCIQKGPKINLP